MKATELISAVATKPLFVLGMASALALAVVGCGGGGGGGDNDLGLLTFNLSNIKSVYLNERLIFTFSAPIDPNTVNTDTIRIRYNASQVDRDGDGQPDDPGNTNASPEGVFTVQGATVIFDPQLPTNEDNSDTGLVPSFDPLDGGPTVNMIYSVTIPGFSSDFPGVVRSTSGAPMNKTYQAVFQTVFDPNFPPLVSDSSFFDTFLGSPYVRAIEASPSAQAADPNSSISVVFSEPILPSSLADPDSIFVSAVGPHSGLEERVGGLVTLTQLPAFTRVTFDPTIPLPGGTTINVKIGPNVTDFGGNLIDLTDPRTPPLVVQIVPTATQTVVVEEQFNNDLKSDADATGAAWGNGFLTPGGGGDGSDGPLVLTADSTITTSGRDIYNFTRLEVPDGVTLKITGTKPARIFVASTAVITGTIDLSGEKGHGRECGDTTDNGLGGLGGPGGGKGGDGDGNATGAGTNGTGPGGGQGSTSSATGANNTCGGGGGGGYGTAGANGLTRVLPGGTGGGTYGDASLNPKLGLLLAGSGGGGAGYTDRNSEPGTGGGGGGGALQLQTGHGIFLVGTTEGGGRVLGDGGASGKNCTALGATGGGGSGGGILLQSAAGDIIVGFGASVTALGGAYGETNDDGGGIPDNGHGGVGGVGRIRVELDLSKFSYAVAGTVNPPANDVGGDPFDFGGVVSVGTSKFIDTGSFFPDYSFDPNGNTLGGAPYVEDNSELFPPGTIGFFFQGAPEDPDNPGHPDTNNLRPPTPTPDINQCDDTRFIRFQVVFRLPDPVPSPLPAVDALRIQFSYN